MDALVEKYAHEPAPRVPGAVEAVTRIAASFPSAIASSAHSSVIHAALRAVGLAACFRVGRLRGRCRGGQACAGRLPGGRPAPRGLAGAVPGRGGLAQWRARRPGGRDDGCPRPEPQLPAGGGNGRGRGLRGRPSRRSRSTAIARLMTPERRFAGRAGFRTGSPRSGSACSFMPTCASASRARPAASGSRRSSASTTRAGRTRSSSWPASRPVRTSGSSARGRPTCPGRRAQPPDHLVRPWRSVQPRAGRPRGRDAPCRRRAREWRAPRDRARGPHPCRRAEPSCRSTTASRSSRLRAGVPIVPVGLSGTGWLRLGKTIRVRVGTPIDHRGRPTAPGRRRALTAEIRAALLALLADGRDEAPPGRFGRWVTELFNDWPEGRRPSPADRPGTRPTNRTPVLYPRTEPGGSRVCDTRADQRTPTGGRPDVGATGLAANQDEYRSRWPSSRTPRSTHGRRRRCGTSRSVAACWRCCRTTGRRRARTTPRDHAGLLGGRRTAGRGGTRPAGPADRPGRRAPLPCRRHPGRARGASRASSSSTSWRTSKSSSTSSPT